MSKKNNNFPNPYVGIPDHEGNYASYWVSIADTKLLMTTRPATGTLTGVMGNLLFKLCNELRKRNITDFTKQDEFERFVLNCHIISDEEYRGRGLHDGAVGGTLPTTTSPNDGTRTEGSSHDPTSATPESSDVQSRSRQRKSGKGKATAKA